MADPTIIVNTTASDQETYLVTQLLSNAFLRMVTRSVLDEDAQPQGTGLTGTFVRYKRMYLPLATLTEAVTPPPNEFTVETVTYTLDQWGDYVLTSDLVPLTTKHPLMEQINTLLADSAARLIDREVQIVWLAGTNIQYGDGTVSTRATITAAMKMDHTTYTAARVTLFDSGAKPRGGPSTEYEEGGEGSSPSLFGAAAYIAFAGPQVIADIGTPSPNFGTWVSAQTYADPSKVLAGERGEAGGIRWIETNFIPRFKLLGDTTEANVSGTDFGTNTPTVTASTTGGSLTAGTYFYKATRKNLLYGFEEDISIAHSTAVGGATTGSFAFAFPASTTHVWNLYFDKTAGGGTNLDANLDLVQANIVGGTTVTVTAVEAGSTNPPPSTPTAAGAQTIHPVYIIGKDFCSWIGLQQLRRYSSGDTVTVADPLMQRHSEGYKFCSKAVIKNQLYMLRVEVASGYSSTR